MTVPPPAEAAGPDIDGMLQVIRLHLGMDVAFLAHVHDGLRTLTHVSAVDDRALVGETARLEDSYCTRVLDARASGDVGFLVEDALADPELEALPITAQLGIRAYAGVPVVLGGGEVFGTLCTYRSDAQPLTMEDAHALQLAAGLIAHRLQAMEWPAGEDPETDLATHRAFDDRLRMAFQPIVDLRTRAIVGHEALARFAHERITTPDAWFRIARRLGVDGLLQRRAVLRTLERMDEVPDGHFVAINLSDAALEDPEIRRALSTGPAERLVVELTEHDLPVDDERLLATVTGLRRELGIRFALDDVGGGYSGLARVLRLEPDIVKIDRSIVGGVFDEPRRQAMLMAFATFARATGCDLVAEGIEQQQDLDALRILGVSHGQGFFLAEPADVPLAEVPPAT